MKPTLNELTAFLSIAEHLNFRRAAVTLGVSPSALSHTIRLLEAGSALNFAQDDAQRCAHECGRQAGGWLASRA